MEEKLDASLNEFIIKSTNPRLGSGASLALTQTLRRGAVQEPTASSAPKTKPWERNLAASPATAAAAAAVAAASG
jgi:hypothetical protein